MHKRRESTSFILQQILDLERLQLTEGSNNLTSGESQNNVSSFKNGTSWNMHSKSDRLQNSLDLGPELQDWVSTHESSVAESFPLPLPDGDSFWECKSPVQSSQVCCYSMSFSPLSRFHTFDVLFCMEYSRLMAKPALAHRSIARLFVLFRFYPRILKIMFCLWNKL